MACTKHHIIGMLNSLKHWSNSNMFSSNQKQITACLLRPVAQLFSQCQCMWMISSSQVTTLQLDTSFKSYLSKCFHVKDLGKYFFGLKLARGTTGLYLYQHKYTLDISSECGMLGCKPCSFPMEQYHRLSLETGREYIW